MRPKSPLVAHQFDDYAQQREADTLGMWTFLLTEVLLFGGLFLGYAVYRYLYPHAWVEGSHHNDVILGGINTGVLLVSSLTVALAVRAAEEDRWRIVQRFLGLTIALAAVFLAIKGYEYYVHYQHHMVPGVRFESAKAEGPQIAMFMVFYFAMTGLHAIHMIAGIGIMLMMMVLIRIGRVNQSISVEMVGLYWHLIDVIWVFLFPLFYLVG